MSHYSVYKVQLGNVTAELLRQAISSLARELGLDAVTTIFDFGRQPHSVVIGLIGRGVEYGIGFNIDEHGNLVIEGDSHMQLGFHRISILAQNYIKAYKVAMNARAVNPAAKMRMSIKQKEVVLEVVV
ncbi:MAG: hypothetical protein QW734_08165 [Candidatus Bathyarchaeia archaeon]